MNYDSSNLINGTPGANSNNDQLANPVLGATDLSATEPTFSYQNQPHNAQPLYFNPSLYQDITLTAFNSYLGVNEIVTYSNRFGPYLQTIFEFESGTIGAPLGSSSFVNFLGSNVYQGLFVATNSILVYDNEQISSYYCETLSYQVNIVNLTAALNSVAQTSKGDQEGSGRITITNFVWTWFTTSYGYAGSQIIDGNTYRSTVNDYLNGTYNFTISSTSQAVNQVQNQITVEQNYLSTAQTYFNNSVTNLQSQISLASQIISSLTSANQAIAANI